MTVEQQFRVLLLGERSAPQTVLERHLAAGGLDVERVEGCEAALARLDAGACELVVIDADRDDDSGLGFCRRLKSNPATAFVPVIAAAGSPSRRITAYEAGVDEFVTQLMRCEEITVRVRALVRLGRMRHMHTADQLAEEVRRREEIRETFKRYVSPALADEILAGPSLDVSQFEHPNRSARASVLFADMRGFTAIAERLDPDQVVRILNEYFALLTEITFRHEGTVFNMAGDCLMVGFGVPLPQADLEVRAVRTGAEMIERFAVLAQSWRQRFGIETGLGVGINAGEVIAGNVGSPSYVSYTIIGDTVNVASRLAQRARAGEMLFSAAVRTALGESPLTAGAVELPSLTVRGRAATLDIFCVPAARRLDLRGTGTAAA
jgi:adenylate cyclase